jgi:hypothetical protein
MPRKRKRKSTSRKRCYHADCNRIAPVTHTCRTCEELAAKAKIRLGDVLSVHCCPYHLEDGLQKLKRHALTAHPFNILRATAAALKGEEVF